ncbi:MAG: FRG domain-containing protein [Bdellovibrionota bacterium]
MKEYESSWDEFKQSISGDIKQARDKRMCRGQADASWPLATSFHRQNLDLSLNEYFDLINQLAEIVGALENRAIDTRDPETNASFLAYLQHHGFPTPILDWTLSPYIAAYFAFSELRPDLIKPTQRVSIFMFDFSKWMENVPAVDNPLESTPHVNIVHPRSAGNLRLIRQQGHYFTFTNVFDVGEFIQAREQTSQVCYLEKYNLAASERSYVMNDLEAMGINSYSLFRTTDALCQHLNDALFLRSPSKEKLKDRLKRVLQTVTV